MENAKLKRNLLIVIIGLLVISGVLIYKKLNTKKLPSYLAEAVGVVDGDLIDLNTKYPGRVEFVKVDTGDEVKKNEVVAKIDDREYNAKLEALNDEIRAKQNELNFTKSKIYNQINIARLALKAKKDELNAVNAQIEALKNVIIQDIKDENRLKKLVKEKFEKHHEYEMAVLKRKTDKDKLNALVSKKEALIKSLQIAKQNLNTAVASKENIKALENAINALRANAKEIKIILSELEIKSPINGYVDTKIANKGEVLGAGMPIVYLIDPESLYLKIYVDTIYTGKIKLGDKAEIFLDAYPNRPIKAVVSKIAKKAEFTPKEVAVRADRITRVYEVRLKPLQPNPLLKLGLPATGVILIGNGSLPKSLDELPEL